jgi:hypothetical protein
MRRSRRFGVASRLTRLDNERPAAITAHTAKPHRCADKQSADSTAIGCSAAKIGTWPRTPHVNTAEGRRRSPILMLSSCLPSFGSRRGTARLRGRNVAGPASVALEASLVSLKVCRVAIDPGAKPLAWREGTLLAAFPALLPPGPIPLVAGPTQPIPRAPHAHLLAGESHLLVFGFLPLIWVAGAGLLASQTRLFTAHENKGS